MLLLFFLQCTGVDDEEWPTENTDHSLAKPLERLNLRTVQTCAVLSEKSPVFPERLVFLYKIDGNGVDAQAELVSVSTTRLRCGEVHLALKPGRDGSKVTMDFMPPKDIPLIEELRVYAIRPTWSEKNPYVIAREVHEPWSDYVFFVNQLLPPFNESSTLLVEEK